MTVRVFPSSNNSEVLAGLRQASAAISRGQVVCIPTDTSYALVADAFNEDALGKLRQARGMPEGAPLGVFVSGPEALAALTSDVPSEVAALVKNFWPGALTLVLPAGDSLNWNLGHTEGTVALRMPAHPIALELLRDTGPVVQSAATAIGQPPLVSPAALARRFPESVSVILSAGADTPGKTISTVVDATDLENPGGKLKIVRQGQLSATELFSVVARERFS